MDDGAHGNDFEPYSITEAQGDELELIVFLRDDCSPSRLLKAALRQLENGRQGRISLTRLDFDAEPEVAAEFGVVGTPTMLLLRKGKVLRRNEGTMTAADLRQWVNGHS